MKGGKVFIETDGTLRVYPLLSIIVDCVQILTLLRYCRALLCLLTLE